MVPPVTNSTGTPVSFVNFLATVSLTRSRQLPPQMLTMSLSCACAGSVKASANKMINTRFMLSLRPRRMLVASPFLGNRRDDGRAQFLPLGLVVFYVSINSTKKWATPNKVEAVAFLDHANRRSSCHRSDAGPIPG